MSASCWRRGQGLLRLVTLAPEVDGGLAAIGQLTAAGVLVSVGHSDATAAQVAAAAGAGARMVTHLYDAQRPLHHREPGVVGQALADPRLTSGLIADLHHVSAVACAIAFAAAPGRICLVTDAAACAGHAAGRVPARRASRSCCRPATACRRAARTATLAGSALRHGPGRGQHGDSASPGGGPDYPRNPAPIAAPRRAAARRAHACGAPRLADAAGGTTPG